MFSLYVFYVVDNQLNKGINTNLISINTNVKIDNIFIDYLNENKIRLTYSEPKSPIHYTSKINNNMLIPNKNLYTIDEKLLSSNNSGQYYVDLRDSDIDINQLIVDMNNIFNIKTEFIMQFDNYNIWADIKSYFPSFMITIYLLFFNRILFLFYEKNKKETFVKFFKWLYIKKLYNENHC